MTSAIAANLEQSADLCKRFVEIEKIKNDMPEKLKERFRSECEQEKIS